MFHILPFMIVPGTLDYFKREYYVKQFKKDRDELLKHRRIVQEIINEKKKFVTFEQVMRYLFKLNFDRPVKNQRDLLPITFN